MSISILEHITKLKEKCMLTEEDFRKSADLSPAEYNALLNINIDETVKSHEFSEKMRLSPSRGSRVIDKLIKRDLIKSRKLRSDKRSVNLSLTEEGKALKEKLNRLRCNCDEKIKNHFSDDEIKQIEDSIIKLLNIL